MLIFLIVMWDLESVLVSRFLGAGVMENSVIIREFYMDV